MPRKGFRPEEIIAKLREADVLLGQGKRVAEVVKALGVSEVTYYRWRREYAGMSVPRARRLKELERENARLLFLPPFSSRRTPCASGSR